MADSDSRGARRWERSLLPYLTLALTPILALPVSLVILSGLPDCGSDEPWWELRDFQLVLLPMIADLLPFAWLAVRGPGVRQAAIVAGLLGAARYGTLQVVTLLYSASSGGQDLNESCTISSPFVGALFFPVAIALWLASVVLLAALWFRKRHAALP